MDNPRTLQLLVYIFNTMWIIWFWEENCQKEA